MMERDTKLLLRWINLVAYGVGCMCADCCAEREDRAR